MTRFLRAAGSISVFTLLSRVLGLIRDRLMAQTLGAGWVQGTFLLAWTLPNLMRRLLGEGALSASFVPAYTAARRTEGDAAARALLGEVTGAVTVLLLPFCALVAAASLLLPAEWLPAPQTGGVASVRLLLLLNAVLFPYALPVCLTAIYAGAMNTLGMFALPAAVPIVLNVFWIAALLLARPLGWTDDETIATFAAVGLTIGGLAQLAVVTVPLWRRGDLPQLRFALPRRKSRAFAVFVAMGPTVLGMSLSQISGLVDQLMAYYLIAPGAVTYLYLANRLLLFPHALTALSVAVAVFPQLAAHATADDQKALRGTLDLSVAATILVTLPAATGLIVLGPDVVAVLFQGGAFGPDDVAPTTLTCSCLVAGLPFIGLAQLYARAFYAVGDAATPARIAMRLVGANVALNVVLLVTTTLGTAGFALSSSICALANAALLARRFRRHAPVLQVGTVRSAFLRSAVATLVMAAVLPLCQLAPRGSGMLHRALLDVALPIVVGIAVYLAVHRGLRSPELRALRRRSR